MSRAGRVAVGLLFAADCVVAAIALSDLVVNGGPVASSLIILTAASVAYATVGSILVARRPGNAIGWLLLALGWTFATSFLPIRATAHELQTLTAPPLVEIVAWFNGWSVSLIFALFATLAFIFPAGTLPGRSSRRVVAAILVVTWGVVVLAAIRPILTVIPAGATDPIEIPNPFGFLSSPIIRVLPIPSDALGPLLPIILLSSIVAIIGRFARARDLVRLQLRWLVAALGAITVAIPVGFALGAVFGQDAAITWVPASVAFGLPPIAIGIAVLRYRLYEIDQIISKTIGWAVVTAIIAALFVGTVVGLQALLADVTQSQTVPVAASTLIAFAVFQPLRRRIQSIVDHRFNRARYDADRLATAFTDRLRDEVDLTAVSVDIAGVVDDALRPSRIGVWIRRSRPTTP
jgi:hypothetical protein